MLITYSEKCSNLINATHLIIIIDRFSVTKTVTLESTIKLIILN